MRGRMFLVFMLVGIFMAGCNHDNQINEVPVIKQIKTFYPEDISTTDRIEILSSNGERRKVENKDRIRRWLDQIGELKVNVDTNPEDSSGVLFGISLFKGENRILSLTPTSINGTAIHVNKVLTSLMFQLWDGSK
ncbi:hypothetical protein [Paenibacillus sp. YPG26]|uniref:hypothetical protein n=1 Tax=Paenibacillus sp. YPG26 TaxID=2878915 RepID=UPI00203E8C13|nr:hypothetical protein [Paenibacillus sp. YPG26]USB34008.1 hypothetical protein LDO05_04070 [Paenibacillus sp. YPG26]